MNAPVLDLLNAEDALSALYDAGIELEEFISAKKAGNQEAAKYYAETFSVRLIVALEAMGCGLATKN